MDTSVRSWTGLPGMALPLWAGPAGVGLVLAAAILWMPVVAVLCTLAALGACLGWVLLERYPRASIGLAPVFILLAWTKFRTRDVTATLSGQADAQVLAELGLHGAAGVIAARTLVKLVGREFRPTSVEWLALAYVGMTFLSTAWSGAPAVTAVRASMLFVTLLVAIAMVRALSPGDALRWLGRSVLVYVAVLWPLAAVAPEHLHFVWENRPGFSWFSMHPGSVATIAATGLVILSGNAGRMLDRRRRGVNVVVLSAAVTLLVLLFLTRSRTHTIGALVALMVIPMFRSRLRAAIPLVAVGLGAILLLSSAPGNLTPTAVLERIATSESPLAEYALRGQSAKSITTLTGRVVVWQDILSLMKGEKLLVGFGYESYRSVLIGRSHWATDPHNASLQALMNVGLIGAALVHLLILQVAATALPRFNRSIEARRDTAVVLGLACFIVLHGVVGGGFAGSGFPPFLAFLVALCAGALRQPTGLPPIRILPPDRVAPSSGAER